MEIMRVSLYSSAVGTCTVAHCTETRPPVVWMRDRLTQHYAFPLLLQWAKKTEENEERKEEETEQTQIRIWPKRKLSHICAVCTSCHCLSIDVLMRFCFFLLLPFSLYFYCCTEWMTIDEHFVAYIIVFTCISFYCSLVSVSVLISFCCCISFRTKVLHVFLSQSFCCQLQKKICPNPNVRRLWWIIYMQ